MTAKPQDRPATPAAGPGVVSGKTQKARPRPDDEPTIKSSTPKSPSQSKAAPKGTTPGQGQADAYKFWEGYYKTHEEGPEQVYKTVADLMQSQNFDHAEAAIKAYLNDLKARKAQPEPWMYIWLVKLIERRKGPEQEVKTTLGFAAYLAKKSRNADDLRRVADMLVIRDFHGQIGQPGYQTNIGELLDLAIELVPSNPYAAMMSRDLALHDKDPKRMADAAESLLSLGWPGIDDKVRSDLEERVKVLDKALREGDRADEADALQAKFVESESRDLYLKLTWTGEADIDMTVDEPLGATAGYRNPRTVFGGAMIKNGYGNHPEEVYVCPRAFDGDYTVRVETIYNDEARPVTMANLEVIVHEGTDHESRSSHKVDLAKPKPVVVHLEGGRRKQVLPYVAAPEPPAAPEREIPKARPAAGPRPANPAPPPGAKPSTIR